MKDSPSVILRATPSNFQFSHQGNTPGDPRGTQGNQRNPGEHREDPGVESGGPRGTLGESRKDLGEPRRILEADLEGPSSLEGNPGETQIFSCLVELQGPMGTQGRPRGT